MTALAAEGFSGTVTDGPLLVAGAVAALVGLIGFLSPCVLPLVPGYLSYVAGLSGEQNGAAGTDGGAAGGTMTATAVRVQPSQRRMVAGALLFVAGFTVIFVAQGALFGTFGSTLKLHQRQIEQVLGAVTIVLGIVFLGGFSFLQREFKTHRLPRAGLIGAPLLGITFGLAWLPCQTPTLGAVDSLAYSSGTAGRGAVLQIFYCLGLGIPFVLVALGVGWVGGALAFVRRHIGVVSRIGGLLLITLGVLLMTGAWDHWITWLQSELGPNAGVGADL